MTIQQRGENAVKTFLSTKGKYIPVQFGSIDSLLSKKEEDSTYEMIISKISSLQDSSFNYGGTDPAKADSFFELSHDWNSKRENFERSFHAEFRGWTVIHDFQFDGKDWTDTFYLDKELSHVDSVKGSGKGKEK